MLDLLAMAFNCDTICKLYFDVSIKSFARVLIPCALAASGSGLVLASDPITSQIADPNKVSDGYLFWHQSDELRTDVDNVSLLTDARGQLVHIWKTDLTGGGTPAYLMETGGVARVGVKDLAYSRGGPVASTDTLQFTDRHGNALWELNAQDFDGIRFHHDFALMKNGNVLVTTYEPLSAQEALNIGWDPGDQSTIWTDGILEIKPFTDTGDYEVVWHWRFADHIVQDKFPDQPNYGVIADTPHRVDPHYPKNYLPKNTVRQHINSLDYNEELDQILLSSLIYDEIWIIDHSTSTEEAASSHGGKSGKGGDLLFRFGNPEVYDRGGPEDRVFLKQHDANWISPGLPGSGNILVHNNNTRFKPRGLGAPQQGASTNGTDAPRAGRELLASNQGNSNVYELRPTREGVANYGPNLDGVFQAETVWVFEHEDYFADFQGGARRLPNGNTLLTDTTDYLVVEVDPRGDIVARYQGATPVFKAFKYSANFVSPLIDRGVVEASD